MLDYFSCINKILKPGGLWVNMGPLRWHYTEQPQEVQVELTLEEVIDLLPKFGFRLRTSEMRKSHYT